MADDGVGVFPTLSLWGVTEWFMFGIGLAFGSAVFAGPLNAVSVAMQHSETQG